MTSSINSMSGQKMSQILSPKPIKSPLTRDIGIAFARDAFTFSDSSNDSHPFRSQRKLIDLLWTLILGERVTVEPSDFEFLKVEGSWDDSTPIHEITRSSNPQIHDHYFRREEVL